ncbi:MAG: hypothetical protein K6B74_11930 [Ruminococcus sp.]|nr:hypothetical protein [Ruminococcus sp.]
MFGKISAVIISVVTAAALCSCGDTSATDTLIERNESVAAAALTTAATTTAATTTTAAAETTVSAEDTSSDESEIDDYLSYVPPVETKSFAEEIDAKNGDIDVDLTLLNATMTYSQVYDMVTNPDLYTDKMIRAKGTFAYTHENDRDYFAALVQDATACCSQGIEFVPGDDKKYPDDFPPLESEIIITGRFHSYKEGVFTYIELLDAEVEAA